MANIRSASKRARQSRQRNQRNVSVKTGYRTVVRNFQILLERDPVEAQNLFPAVTQAIDQAAGRGVIHANTAARKKARLARKLRTRLAKVASPGAY